MATPTEAAAKTIPDELLPAVKHLRKSFDTIHWQFGYTTEQLCFWKLHNEQTKRGTKNFHEYVDALPALKKRAGAVASGRFDRVLLRGTPPAIFKAFYELYIEGVKLQIQLIFQSLLQIGESNRNRISLDPVEWARRLSEEIILYHDHRIPAWIKGVCDEQPYDSAADPDEMIYWRSWRAPNLLVMEPSRFALYEPERVWERNDQTTSESWLQAFRDDYALRLKIQVTDMAGTAALERAMQPQAVPKSKESLVSQTFNLHGPNQRVNINSTDNSSNVVHYKSQFEEVRSALKRGVSDSVEGARLLQALDDLENSGDRESAASRYTAFVTLAANHITLLGPFLPVLGHWVHTLATSIK